MAIDYWGLGWSKIIMAVGDSSKIIMAVGDLLVIYLLLCVYWIPMDVAF